MVAERGADRPVCAGIRKPATDEKGGEVFIVAGFERVCAAFQREGNALAHHLAGVALRLAATGGFRLATLVAGLFVVLVLTSFLQDARLLDLLLEAAQRLIQRLILANLDLSQKFSPLPSWYDAIRLGTRVE